LFVLRHLFLQQSLELGWTDVAASLGGKTHRLFKFPGRAKVVKAVHEIADGVVFEQSAAD